MPHTPEEKKRAVTRLRRIRGQTDALIAAVERGEECGALLQQLAALRGAATGLMAEVLESHLRETMQAGAGPAIGSADDANEDEIAAIMRVIRPYLK
ncbi:DNA-binding FrmR family transcriptional regulator [Bosea sp. OAE752]|jgi:DNA-binding FrmR family transcriptional regulator|uniref:Metal-sensing transcriptional repressor n=1 Tax=Bosea spartocytisi TaxID=2773451 RepID=A0A927ECH1_9HYPH|nr:MULTISPECIES: metal-sensing transcriptional repressor [Bosea]MBD3848736.1 metal-sensing transcriptional repressor [Bosea spartocytisi]MCT4473804.1 metal-sensing transcriptional repressor [Bosea spartocytisi]